MSSIDGFSAKSPWASINDVLIQNKCWLCLNTFPRERQKSVFEVSDLLTFYHNQHKRSLASAALVADSSIPEEASSMDTAAQDSSTSSNIDKDFKFISKNLQACYDSYVALMSAGEGRPDKLFEEFKANDVEVWMSGLVCGGTPECRQELAYFIENKQHASGGGNGGDKKKVNEMFSFAIPNGSGCPPGCNCEPTWPFMP